MTGDAGGARQRRTGSLTARWLALSPNLRGVLWMLMASTGFTVMSALVKLLSESLDVIQVVFFRCVVGLLLLLPFVLAAGPGVLRTAQPKLHAGRAICGVLAMSCGFYAFAHLPLATATAVSFTKPLFMVFVAVLLLGEAVRWRRWTATVIGFLGVLIMVRPDEGALDPAVFVSLAGALFVALSVALVKSMPPRESNLTILFYFALASTTVALVPALLIWRPPTLEEWAIGGAIGLLGVASQAAIVRAYRVAEATIVAPFDYTRLLLATLLGLWMFAEVPDIWVGVGALVIVASTVYIARREARVGLPPKAGPTPH